ncbi:MAG: acyl-CoA dehydrogenase family protein [Acidimicrobiia bacterium]
MSAAFSGADLAAFAEALARFGDHSREKLFGPAAAIGPDGDLAAIPALLGEARSTGLMSDPAPEEFDGDFGVWGGHVLDHGCRLSLLTLGSLGESCAGLAAAVHAQGIGCLALGGSRGPGGAVESGATVAAAFVPGYGVAFDERTHSDALSISVSAGRSHIHGRSPFVWSAGTPDWLAVVARDAQSEDAGAHGSWIVAAVPVGAAGVRIAPVGRRIGLRAIEQLEVNFDRVELEPDAIVAAGDQAALLVTRVVACDWLGLAAISLGTARAAIREAKAYAATRHQGGRTIARHAAVRILLAEASHHLATLAALLDTMEDQPMAQVPERDLLRRSASARLGIGEHAAGAVSNCVQVLGGYGYMDDYGISKRLRDVSVLRSRHGSREQLLLLLDDLSTEEAATGKVA